MFNFKYNLKLISPRQDLFCAYCLWTVCILSVNRNNFNSVCSVGLSIIYLNPTDCCHRKPQNACMSSMKTANTVRNPDIAPIRMEKHSMNTTTSSYSRFNCLSAGVCINLKIQQQIIVISPVMIALCTITSVSVVSRLLTTCISLR